jgi:arylsulfatase A-like enzyme
MSKLSLVCLLALGITVPAEAQERPNFLIIVTDDMGYTDLGAFGGDDIPTPNLDALAWNGVRLTNFHAAPSCAPTRAMLMSGTGNHEAGLGSQLFNQMFAGEYGYERFLQKRIAAMPEVLQDGGYHTMMSGKWHISEGDASRTSLPRDFGFERDYTLLRGADNHYGSIPAATYSLDGAEHRLEDLEYSTIRYTNHLIEFLGDHAGSEQPFFAVFAPTAPHWPLQYPPGWEDRFTGAFTAGFDILCNERMAGAQRANVLPTNANVQSCNKESSAWTDMTEAEQQYSSRLMEIYAAMAAHMDDEVGRILSFMEEEGMLDNTWIIYMNDNGPQGGPELASLVGSRNTYPYNNSFANLGKNDSWVSIGQGWADATNSPFRNSKGTSFEGGMRVAAFAWHRSAVTQGSVDRQFLTVMDIMPTVLDLAGLTPPIDTFNGRDILSLRGKSFSSALTGSTVPVHAATDAIALDHSGNRMMVQGDWKIVQQPRREWLLFNLADDPSESYDLAEIYPEVLDPLVKQFYRFALERNYIEVNATINQP